MSLEDIRSSQEVGTDLAQPDEVTTLNPSAPEASEMASLLEGMDSLGSSRWRQARLYRARF